MMHLSPECSSFNIRSLGPESLAGRMLLRHWYEPDSPDVDGRKLNQPKPHRKGLYSSAYKYTKSAMNDPFFFGYGSLVNRATHSYERAQTAQITGWRRAWRRSLRRDLCYLTAIPDPNSRIDGLIAAVPNADWEALDLREIAYVRQDASHQVRHQISPAPEVAVYAIAPDVHHPTTPETPILLSYLDVVVQGYLAEFGEAGVTRFFASTDGWDTPILNDRAAPRYPRAQTLNRSETALVDWHLANLS